jgi:uncharacterized protein YjiS (DUF1127 family)
MDLTRRLAEVPVRSAHGASGTAGLVAGAAAALRAWWRNRQERRALAGLDDNLLRDVGLTRADVDGEYDRPFWQPVDYGALDSARRRSGPRLGARR